WYLVYLSHPPQKMCYCSAENLNGPWTVFPDRYLDDRFYISGRVRNDGRRMFMLGWIPYREGERDEGGWRWGGHMAVTREVFARTDGSLGIRCLEEIVNAFREVIIKPGMPVEYEKGTGIWSTDNRGVTGSRDDGFAFIKLPQSHDNFYFEAKVNIESLATSAGFMFRMSDNIEAGYTLLLEPFARRVAFRDGTGVWEFNPHIERLLEIQPGKPVKCQVIVEDTTFEAFFDDKIALSTRIYNHKIGRICLFVQNGKARFEDIQLKKL
ncbi:hypothetical protein HY605_02320, partial [Candidatus Peregrinibacteria bacterium]|nr:hypothetical protein [Candidatus Peregrinibacteria bacterium]